MRSFFKSTSRLLLALGSLALSITPVIAVDSLESSEPVPYPLTTCIVSGEALGAHGETVIREVEGREIKLCCKSCVENLEENPKKFLEALDSAIVETQLAEYPLDTCLVSGKALGGEMGEPGEPVDFVFGNRLIRLCRNSCKKDFLENSATLLSRLDQAVVRAQIKDYPASTCPISGQPLGSMGDPYPYVFAGKLVQFCCAGCIGAFHENPAQALAEIYSDAGGQSSPEAGEHGDRKHDHSKH